MKNKEIKIISPKAEHKEDWIELWKEYCGSHFSEEMTQATWQRILNPQSFINALIAIDDNKLVGFVIFVTHEGTWELKPLCYIEDLFIHKKYRGDKIGVGHLFSHQLLKRLEDGEWSRLYGITRKDNIVAQRLYKNFAEGEEYLRYVIKKKKI